MGGALGGDLTDVGTLHGCVALRRRSIEEVDVEKSGGLGGFLAGGGTLCGILVRCRGSKWTGKSG